MTLADFLTLRPRGHSLALWQRLYLGLLAWRQRRALAALPQDRLDDLGLTLDEARREAARPFWDVPQHWLR